MGGPGTWSRITSLIPNPHDFFLSYIGQDPVIVTRDADGEIHVLLNICRHRGNRLTRADDGNAKSFMCTYHGWNFNNDGRLSDVPGEQEAYYGELNKSELGLIEAKVDTYAGIIFATLGPRLVRRWRRFWVTPAGTWTRPSTTTRPV